MRGMSPLERFAFSDTYPSPVSIALRAIEPPSPTRGEGKRSRLAQLDLVGDLVRKRDAADGQHHLRRQFLVALQRAGLDGVAHGLFDLALRGDADLLQEFPQAGVEDILVHASLPVRALSDCSASARQDCAG